MKNHFISFFLLGTTKRWVILFIIGILLLFNLYLIYIFFFNKNVETLDGIGFTYKDISFVDISYTFNNPNILPLTKYNTNFNSYYYDPNNYDLQYHSNEDNLYGTSNSGTWVQNPSGKLEFIKWIEMPSYSTYYTPGAFLYGPSNYIPSYEDTVYLKYNSTNKE